MRTKMKNTALDVIAKGFKICCFFLAGYMIVQQTLRYFENEDSTTIHYKKFNESPSDLYPTFSICFEDKFNGAYNRTELSNTLGITRSKYVKLLLGKHSPDINVTDVATNATMTKNALNVDVRNVSLQFHDIFQDFKSEALNNSQDFIRRYQKGDRDAPFYVSYQDPARICFTRKRTFEKGIVFKVDQLWTSKIRIMKKLFSMLAVQKIYLHHPGQLMRSFGKETYERQFFYVTSQNHYVDISVVLVSVLRKREDGQNPCDPKLKDEDAKIRSQIIKQVGCVPPYWKPFTSQELGFSDCNSPLQLIQIYESIKNYKSIMESYHEPCNEMRIVSIKQWKAIPTPGVGISYVDEVYEEVVNHRSFGFEMFWSGIGGFVGMFLGFSFLQIPEMIFKIMQIKS